MIFIYMKLIITESKLKKIITKFLNKFYGDLFVKDWRKYNFLQLFDTKSTGLIIFTIDNDVLHIVNNQLIEDLQNYFNLKDEELDGIFIPWMESTYGIKIISARYNPQSHLN